MSMYSTHELTPRERRWSRGVWAAWLGCFGLLEALGLLRRSPWVTLSETSWDAETSTPSLNVGLLGFLLGLAVHLRQRRGFWRSMAGGIGVAAIAKLLWDD